MLAYISLGIGLCNILVGFVFFLTWIELHERIKNSPTLQEDFQAAVRRLMISVGFLAFPFSNIYLRAISSLQGFWSFMLWPGASVVL